MTRETLSQKIVHLLESHYLLAAPDLIDLLHQQNVSCNKTSVYRALDKLFEDGMVCRHSMGGTHILYGLKNQDKMHLVCLCCGKVQIVDDTLTINTTEFDNFTSDHRHITIFGKCDHCKHLAKACKDLEIHVAH